MYYRFSVLVVLSEYISINCINFILTLNKNYGSEPHVRQTVYNINPHNIIIFVTNVSDTARA